MYVHLIVVCVRVQLTIVSSNYVSELLTLLLEKSVLQGPKHVVLCISVEPTMIDALHNEPEMICWQDKSEIISKSNLGMPLNSQ